MQSRAFFLFLYAAPYVPACLLAGMPDVVYGWVEYETHTLHEFTLVGWMLLLLLLLLLLPLR
jgi:hypothetical protein